MNSDRDVVVVTGANGLVGGRVAQALADRDVHVRAVVRRAGSAPALPGIEETVGDFSDPAFAATAVTGASAVVTTVHPMGSDRATQHRIGVVGTSAIATAAADAGVDRLIHISTAAVYDRSPDVGDVDESSALVGDDAGDYAVTKRDADLALGEIEGITRVLLRPPAILGSGPTSVWNTRRPAAMREDPQARQGVAEHTFAWVHASDLASLAAELAGGEIPDAADVRQGPLAGECVALNVAAGPATERDYLGTVADALGVEPVWERASVWTGQILADRARGWGWTPSVDLTQALTELAAGLRLARTTP